MLQTLADTRVYAGTKHVWFGPSDGKGRGVFASHALSPDTLVLLDPILVVSSEVVANTLLEAHVLAWPDEDGNDVAFPLGLIALVNHSQTPNTILVRLPEKEMVGLQIVRFVEKGEEICYDYGDEWEEEFKKCYKP